MFKTSRDCSYEKVEILDLQLSMRNGFDKRENLKLVHLDLVIDTIGSCVLIHSSVVD